MNKHDSQENLSIPGRFKMLRPPKPMANVRFKGLQHA